MVGVAAAGEPYPGRSFVFLDVTPGNFVREAAEPSAATLLPARDGSERRQIPCPFSGRIKRACVGRASIKDVFQLLRMFRGSCPPARKKGNERELTNHEGGRRTTSSEDSA